VIGGMGMGTQKGIVVIGDRNISFANAPCWPAVWLDGQLVHPGRAGGRDDPAYIDQLVHPVEIAGIEIYNSPASHPVQYNLYGACGVIVIWTRHGR
jgi:hypothetical protein